VVIRADQNASFQPVVNVMDVCNRTGVSDYSVSTKDGPAG
jgi:biopolymer transport protein ExbD